MIVEKEIQSYSKKQDRMIKRGTVYLIRAEDWPNRPRVLAVERTEAAAKDKEKQIRMRNPQLFTKSDD